MKNQPTDDPFLSASQVLGIAEALFRQGQRTALFLRDEVRQRLPLATVARDDEAAILGAFLRIDAWMQTMTKCNGPADYQAVAAGARALLESTVDLVLLCADRTNAEVVRDWEESAKLKHAACLVAYYTKLGMPLPDQDAAILSFFTNHHARIEKMREARGWVDRRKKTRHPGRWTDRDLGEDARRADAVDGSCQLEQFYETRYRELCWHVHGSGLAGVRGLSADLFPGLGARALADCCRIAVAAAVVTLRQFGALPAEGASFLQEFVLRESETLANEIAKATSK